MGSYTNKNTTRYPAYLEEAHEALLTVVHDRVEDDYSTSPLSGREDLLIDDLFIDAGKVVSNYPALFDVFGKFMAGLDITTLFDQVVNDTTSGRIASDFVANKSAILETEVSNSLTRFNSGIDDISFTMNSIHMTGNDLIRDRKEKLVSRFAAETKYKLLPIAIDRWSAHISWNKAVVSQYIEIIKLYYKTKIEVNNFNIELNARDDLWPLDLLEFERSIIGLLTGAGSSSSSGGGGGGEPDALMGALGGAMSGAATGAMVGGPWGAVIGGALGAAASFL